MKFDLKTPGYFIVLLRARPDNLYKSYRCRMSWRSSRLFVCNINFSGEDVIRIFVEFFNIFDQTIGGKCSWVFFTESQFRKRFFKNYSVTKSDDCGILQEFWPRILVGYKVDDRTMAGLRYFCSKLICRYKQFKLVALPSKSSLETIF